MNFCSRSWKALFILTLVLGFSGCFVDEEAVEADPSSKDSSDTVVVDTSADGILVGRVTDGNSGNPIVGATISVYRVGNCSTEPADTQSTTRDIMIEPLPCDGLTGILATAITGSNGAFRIEGLLDGSWTLSIYAEGYQSTQVWTHVDLGVGRVDAMLWPVQTSCSSDTQCGDGMICNLTDYCVVPAIDCADGSDCMIPAICYGYCEKPALTCDADIAVDCMAGSVDACLLNPSDPMGHRCVTDPSTTSCFYDSDCDSLSYCSFATYTTYQGSSTEENSADAMALIARTGTCMPKPIGDSLCLSDSDCSTGYHCEGSGATATSPCIYQLDPTTNDTLWMCTGALPERGYCIPNAPTDTIVFCPQYYSPVCGSNGKTYANSCEAEAAGVSVLSSGECIVVDSLYAVTD